jgi:hypothetical protein
MINALPFGRHKGVPLPDVPASYLQWALRECQLSAGLRAALAAELARRSIEAPPMPPPAPPRTCRRCPGTRVLALWQETRDGGRRIRGECSRCRCFVAFLPEVEPYLSEANRRASAAPILDALTGLEALGVDLESDGSSVWFARDGWRRVPPDLRAVVGQCNHRLAVLLGNTARRRQGMACSSEG